MRKNITLLLLLSGIMLPICVQSENRCDTMWRDSVVEVCGEWEVRQIEPNPKMKFGAVLNNVTLPLEVGCAFTPKAGQTRPGFYMRTSLEYRSRKTTGWCVAAEFDSYTRQYEMESIRDINITKGRDWTIDILAGGGYRVPLVRDVQAYMQRPKYNNVWSLGFMLYAGASCQTLEDVVPAGMNTQGETTYHTQTIDTWVPSAKLTTSVEYCICYGISVYATVGYLQHFQKTRLESDFVGELITSVGITCFFR